MSDYGPTVSFSFKRINEPVRNTVEYKLCMCLLCHFEWLQQPTRPTLEAPNIYVSFEELQRCANLAERGHVIRHVSNTNGKLKVHGITILCVGECGYTLSFQRSSALDF